MNETVSEKGPRKKKSVALSGVPAGNTALCTVGRTGNDLHYRGYDILDLAEHCEFEEVAHLLVHEKLPTAAELATEQIDEENARLRGEVGDLQRERAFALVDIADFKAQAIFAAQEAKA